MYKAPWLCALPSPAVCLDRGNGKAHPRQMAISPEDRPLPKGECNAIQVKLNEIEIKRPRQNDVECFSGLTYSKRSVWLPVLSKIIVFSFVSILYINNQSGVIWHSLRSLKLPCNL